MFSLRYIGTLVTCIPYALYAIPRANYMNARPNRYARDVRYDFCRAVSWRIKVHASTMVKTYGLENLPKSGGYIMYANHQGHFDGFAVVGTHEAPMSILWEEKSASRIVARQLAGLTNSKTISFTNHRAQVKVLNEIVNEVKSGEPYLIFPEGGYTDNRNELQEFKSGCFMCATKAKVPLVPVVLYDSWRALDMNKMGIARVQVHYLKPIPYEEYVDMDRKEVGELVKSRIAEKLEEIKARDPRLNRG